MKNNEIELFGYSEYFFDESSKLRKMDFHSHNSIEISYVSAGELFFDYFDKDGNLKSVSLHKNQLAICKPFVKHKTNVTIGLVSFGVEFVSHQDLRHSICDLMAEEGLDANQVYNVFDDIIILQDVANVKDTISQFKNYINNDNEHVKTLLKLEMKKLFLQILLCSEKHNVKKESNKHVNDAVVFIKQSFNRPLKSSDVAKHVGLSDVYFQKLFKQCMGIKFNRYLNVQRINYAIDLIKSTNYSLGKIAAMAGYNSLQIFTRNFLLITNQTPKEYQHGLLKQQINLKIDTDVYQETRFPPSNITP